MSIVEDEQGLSDTELDALIVKFDLLVARALRRAIKAGTREALTASSETFINTHHDAQGKFAPKSSGGFQPVGEEGGRFIGSPESKWTWQSDGDKRAAAAWSQQYDDMNMVRSAELSIHKGETPKLGNLSARQALRNSEIDVNTGEKVHPVSDSQYRAGLIEAAHKIHNLPVTSRNESLHRGMRVDDVGQFKQGDRISLDHLTSFTPDKSRAGLYAKSSNDRPGAHPVIVTMAPGGKTRRLSPDVMTGSQNGSTEDLFRGELEIVNVVPGAVTEVHVRAV